MLTKKLSEPKRCWPRSIDKSKKVNRFGCSAHPYKGETGGRMKKMILPLFIVLLAGDACHYLLTDGPYPHFAIAVAVFAAFGAYVAWNEGA